MIELNQNQMQRLEGGACAGDILGGSLCGWGLVGGAALATLVGGVAGWTVFALYAIPKCAAGIVVAEKTC